LRTASWLLPLNAQRQQRWSVVTVAVDMGPKLRDRRVTARPAMRCRAPARLRLLGVAARLDVRSETPRRKRRGYGTAPVGHPERSEGSIGMLLAGNALLDPSLRSG